MQRRTIVRSMSEIPAGVTRISTLAAIAPAPRLSAGQPRTLRFGHLHATKSAIHTSLKRACKVLECAPQGRLKLDVFPASQLGTAIEMQNKEAYEEARGINDQRTRTPEDELQVSLSAKGMQVIESDRSAFLRIMESVHAKYLEAWGIGDWQGMKILK